MRVTVEELIRSRRTHKAYDPEPVDRATLEALFELARWAPEPQPHQPVALPRARPAVAGGAEAGGGPGGGGQARPRADARGRLRRCARTIPVTDEEDHAAGAAATFILLLGAHARGLGGYWRTPGVLRTPEGRAACGIPESERVLGLVHLGRAKGPDKAAPERAPLDDFRAYLDRCSRARTPSPPSPRSRSTCS